MKDPVYCWCVGVKMDRLLCSEFLEMDMTLSEEDVQLWKDLFVKYATSFADYARHVVLIEDVVDTLKACVICCCHNLVLLLLLLFIFCVISVLD